MKIDRKSLGFQVVVPSFFIVVGVFVFLLVVIDRITNIVQDDYSRFIATAAGNEASEILASKSSELTSSALMDNEVVSEAMRKSTREALTLSWSRMGHQGIIAVSDGSILNSTLPAPLTRAIADHCVPGYFTIRYSDTRYDCHTEIFPLWGWKVITVVTPAQGLMTRSKIGLLTPFMAIGCLLMSVGIYWILKRNLNRPVARMVSAIGRGEQVEATGVTELDFIGNEVNSAFRHLHEKTAALELELNERIRAEQEVRARDEHIRLLLSSTAEGIFGLDTSGRCTFCNPSVLAMLGFDSEEQLLGTEIHRLIHHTLGDGTPCPEQECKIHSAHREGKLIYEAEDVFWRSDGVSFPVEFWAHPIVKDGSIAGTVVTFIDISQRKQLEQQLLHAQKIESVGRLAGGVAHDFNNLLTPIIGYAELLKMNVQGNDPASTRVDYILKAADKARVLVQQLLSFSRKQILEMKVIDLNQVIRAFSEMLRSTIRENIDIRLELCRESHGIRADAHQIEQVIMNLAVNAQDAINGNGVITIETAQVLLDDEYCRQHGETIAGPHLMLAVTDNGCGMDSDTLGKIFEPFFTTKAVGQGTGLGLATVYGLVKQHGGNIWVYSEPGRGTTFKCYFPVVDEMPDIDMLGISKQEAFSGEKRTILLVEDNQMARELAHELLKELGFEVIVAATPAMALQLVEGISIEMLITDVVMPGMTGSELNDCLQKKYPGLKTLYMSGYTNNVIVHHGILIEGINFIQKPFAIHDFAKKVKSILNQ
ncbi:MAG: hypothetical protein A2X82_16645 [Geobacteraceae bacterium GWC2_55_20]|nr:MAG: hypothetical protein A2X82_16645 [Geobacteraceae bacterium GWC2_55_20]HCE66405.1 hypothetical protein [Geobacter sp.]